MNKTIFIILIIFLTISFSMAQLVNGSKTLLHTQTGNTSDQGQFNINLSTNFFTKAAEYIGSNQAQDVDVAEYWLVAGNIVMTYGIIEHFDATIGLKVYQDTHRDNEYNLPDDLFLTLRAGSIPFGQNHFQNAFLASMRFPTGEEHNYPMAEYASGSFEYGLMYALSFFSDAYLPERSVGVHFNIGWWNHNESGTKYTFNNGTEYTANRNSNDIRLALAFAIPSTMFDFRIETSGILYLRRPNDFIYSAEEWAFLSPSIRYKPIKGLNLDLGMDIRLSPSDRQWTTAEGVPDISSSVDISPNYPAWKIHLGADIELNFASKKLAITSEKNYQRAEAREKIELFEKILKEREKAKDVQEELQSLRKVRKEAEEEIEEIKKILDE
ncbi:MAG: hypothetical protein JW956_01890 [Calditrichaceae bacterium]|nr:hypothetical protein [Calditrichaceae bacterium]